jgi:uncharacterized protein (DUF362 family)
MAVSIHKGRQIRVNLEKAFRDIGFQPGRRVFIKPNLCGRHPILPGENTSIHVMDALIDVLRGGGGGEVVIGHGTLLASGDHKADFSDFLKDAGFDKYQAMHGVRIANLDDLDRQEVEVQGMVFHLPTLFLEKEVDTYINLAKIKTHMETTVSFCLKNQMGMVTHIDRIQMHRGELEKAIALLGAGLKPDLSILEGYPAMEGRGPHHGRPRNLELIVAGTDMVEVDSLAATLLGYRVGEIPHLTQAEAFGVGRQIAEGQIENWHRFGVRNFKKADPVYRLGRRILVYPTYSCSRCITAVDEAGKRIKKSPLRVRLYTKALFSLKRIHIVFGKADHLALDCVRDKVVCIGKCSKRFAEEHEANFLDGCPPITQEVEEHLKKNVLN